MQKNPSLDSLLLVAIKAQNAEKVMELIKRGADPNMMLGDLFAVDLVEPGDDATKCALIEGGAYSPSLCHALSWAVGTKRLKTVQALIDKGADINTSPLMGTPILVAARHGYLEIAKALITAGADLDAGNSIGTPLLEAIENHHFAVAMQLIEAGADPNHKNLSQISPLAMAVCQGATKIVELLIKKGAKLDEMIPEITVNSQELKKQAQQGLQSAFKAMTAMENMENTVQNDNQQELGMLNDILANLREAKHKKTIEPDVVKNSTAVTLAARGGHAGVLRVLLEAGANGNAKDGEGLTAYDWGIKNDEIQVLEVLKKFGIEGSQSNPDERLIQAVVENDIAKIQECLRQGADVNARDSRSDTQNFTSLMLAVKNNHIEVVEFLLQSGANPNFYDIGEDFEIPEILHEEFCDYIEEMGQSPGKTALTLGIENGSEEIVRLLLQNGANAARPNSIKVTPLHLACQQSNLTFVRLLVENGADVNLQDYSGNTPLLIALEKKHREIAEFLLQQQADVKIVNNNKTTALMLAASLGAESLIENLGKSLDVYTKNDLNMNALDYAIAEPDLDCIFGKSQTQQQQLQTLKLLLRLGENSPDKTFPLQRAVQNGFLEIMELLLENGAEVEDQDEYGDNAYDVAVQYEQQRALELLKKYAKEWPPQKASKPQEDSQREQERLGPAVSQPTFSTSREFEQAVAELAEICQSKPIALGSPGYFELHVANKQRDKVRTGELQAKFLEQGFFVYEPVYSFDGQPQKLAIAATGDKYQLIALHQTNGCNFGIGTGYIIQWLQELEQQQPFVLTCIAYDTLAGRFLTPIKNPREWAQRMYDFCPDIVDQGVMSIEALEKSLAANDGLFFWWD